MFEGFRSRSDNLRGRSGRRLCGAALALAFCGFQPLQVGAEDSPTAVLAKVGDRIITKADFESFKVPIIRMTSEGAQTDSALLRSYVDRTLLILEAERLGIDKEADIIQALTLFKKAQLVKAYRRQAVDSQVSASEEEVLEHFHASERHRAVRVAGILLETKKEAADVLDAIEAGGDFAELAREYSLYENAEEGGDTGKFFYKDTTSDALKDHIFKMALNEVSEPLPFFGRWTLIKILDEVPVELSEVEDFVRGEVLIRKKRERTDAVVDSLTNVYGPVKFETTVEQLKDSYAGSVEDSTRLDAVVLCTFARGQLTFGDFRGIAPAAARTFLGKLDPWGPDFTEADKIDSLVNEALPTRLFLEEGLKLGLEDDPKIEAAVLNESEDLLVSSVYRREVEEKISDVTLQEARSFYEQNPKKFQTTDTIIITEILVRFEQEAAELRRQIDEGADPAELATQHTIRPGADHHKGKLELTAYKEVRLPGRWDIVKDMQVGEVAGPIKVDEGYTILVVQENKPAETKPFKASSQRRSKAYISIHKARLKYVEVVAGLYERFPVEVFEENL